MEILLVEPSYRSKFPPIGLLRLAAYHKSLGDSVFFVRGNDGDMRARCWDRIYVASLFTWELPRTVAAVRFYSGSVARSTDVIVGGIGATLNPEYVRKNVACTVVEGQLDHPTGLGRNCSQIANTAPDYDMLKSVPGYYSPNDAYFMRLSKGCIRRCSFCAVPRLEPTFGHMQAIKRQIREVDRKYGARQNLVLLDNNILAVSSVETILREIADAGFGLGSRRGGKRRTVDFNQGLDARIIAHKQNLATSLGMLQLSPVRLAFDTLSMKESYIKAVRALREAGFWEFTNYMLFNFSDSPKDLFDRLKVNNDLNRELCIQITGFPMRYIPMQDTNRHFVSKKWKWRYLRGIQCVLLATRGMVSPNPSFVERAFGSSFEEFVEILCMPDRYIIYREDHERNDVIDWRRRFRRLSGSDREEFLQVLEQLNRNPNRKTELHRFRKFGALLDHYYPNGECPRI